LGGEVLVTADHGNAEEMIDPKTERVKTSHSLNPVELIYISDNAKGRRRQMERGPTPGGIGELLEVLHPACRRSTGNLHPDR
ncbi:MAG: hypothetical protein JRF64_11055, partial [Deltaproteobacteria bacterium]|nr:hypothetical protein [Deltaproteobacteria bacterium]